MMSKRLFKSIGIRAIFVLSLIFTFSMMVSAADEIKVGIIGPMKFLPGQHMVKGAQFAADEINAAGGVVVKNKRYKIVLVEADDNSILSIPDALSAMERLVNRDRVRYVIGGLYTEAVVTQMEVMADNKIIYLCVSAVNEDVPKKVGKDYDRYKYWFRVTTNNAGDIALTYIAQIEPILRAIRSELNVSTPRVALLMDEAQWTAPAVAILKRVLPKMGCELVGVWKTSIKATNLTAELSAIKAAEAHLIIQANAGPAGNVLSRQWGEMKIPAAISGSNTEAQQHAHWAATDGKCNYMAITEQVGGSINKTSKTKQYLEGFNKKYGSSPIYTAHAAYDSIYILKEAIEKANDFSPERLVPMLEKTDYTGPLGRIKFAPRGSATPHATMWGPDFITGVGTQWRDGKFVTYWPDKHEIHPALVAEGAPTGWDKVQYEGTQKYVLPPWVVEYWKSK